jgi:2,3-bisphosphoglycerate-independent phosphoglycerate mutase
MKYAVLVADGMSDHPLQELDGRTPIEVARTHNMDKIAREGQLGLAMIPESIIPGVPRWRQPALESN